MHPDEYLKLAEVEDQMWYFRALHGHVLRELTQRLTPRISGEILDAGCGTGGFLKRASAVMPQRHFRGIDLSPMACELARERCAATIGQASITALPFAADSFAAVVSLDVLVQIPDPETALAEFYRVLKPGGVAVINAAAYRWLWSYHDEAVQSKRRYTRPELRNLLQAVGFQIERATYWNFLPLPLIIVRRKILPKPREASDVKVYPRSIERIFDWGMAAEHWWMTRLGPLPAGCSVFMVARKPDALAI